MLTFLEIPKSNYYRWKNKPDDEAESELIERIREICSKHKRRYGYSELRQY
jgi:hypothetical protein